ncbi:MAG: helix-turn-helix domain-containing protein [Muribaculaceae bacterium]|nr:helix-turn-helix domain-containing protein [Muribaculaceae bacterium]
MGAALIAAGEREHNKRVLGYGYGYLGSAQLMIGETNQASENLHRAIEIGETINNDTILSTAYNSLGIYEASVTRNLYLAQRYFYKSRQHARDGKYSRIERSIGSNLAELAIELNDTSGLQYAQECYDYGVEADLPRFEYSGALNLAELYKIKGDYDLADRYATIAMSLAQQYGYEDIGQINLIFSIIAMGKGDALGTAEYALKAIEALKNTISLPKAYLMLAKAYRAQGKYTDSLAQLKLGEEAAREYFSFGSIAEIYELMADNYESLGKSDDALKYLRLAKDLTDSHYRTDRKRMDQERSLILDLEEKENKMKIQSVKVQSQSRLIISLSLGILLLIVLLVIVVVNQHKKRKLYENLVEQNRRVVALRDEMLKTTVHYLPPKNSSVISECEDISEMVKEVRDGEEITDTKSVLNEQKSDDLYAALCRLMKEERLFADLRVTRETVIEKLGTNRTYLTQIIAKHGWTNYSHFVNSFRIDEAIKILSDKTRDIKMRDLYSELGFGSQATFYKTFSSVTGMSPVVFRKSVK